MCYGGIVWLMKNHHLIMHLNRRLLVSVLLAIHKDYDVLGLLSIASLHLHHLRNGELLGRFNAVAGFEVGVVGLVN